MRKLILCALLVMVLGVTAGCGLRLVVREDYRTEDTIIIVDPPVVVDYRYRYGSRDCWRYRGCYGAPYHGHYHGYGPYPYYYGYGW